MCAVTRKLQKSDPRNLTALPAGRESKLACTHYTLWLGRLPNAIPEWENIVIFLPKHPK